MATGMTASASDATATVDPDDSGGGCVPGQSGCSCLEGACVSGAYCVEEVCALGPQIDLDEDRAVVGGVVVPLEAQVTADEFSWEQVSGPPVEILGAQTLQISIPVPADAAPDEEIVLRLTATRNGVTLSADLTVEVLAASFHDVLPQISDPMQLGTAEGLALGATGLWVVSSEGFASQFNPAGEFIQRIDVTGEPVGADFNGENLIIANREGTGRIQQLNSVSGNLSTLFDSLSGGGPLGTVGLPLVDDDDDLFVSTGLDQTVLRYDAELGVVSPFLEDAVVVNPMALAFGPEGNTIYVGAQGHVWRVPIVDGMAGTPQDYLVLGDDADPTYQVHGLMFDEGSNLWVSCPSASSLYVAHYSAMGPAEISRTFSNVGGGISSFNDLSFGRGDFERDTLYYTNATDGTVGRLQVGLQAL